MNKKKIDKLFSNTVKRIEWDILIPQPVKKIYSSSTVVYYL